MVIINNCSSSTSLKRNYPEIWQSLDSCNPDHQLFSAWNLCLGSFAQTGNKIISRLFWFSRRHLSWRKFTDSQTATLAGLSKFRLHQRSALVGSQLKILANESQYESICDTHFRSTVVPWRNKLDSRVSCWMKFDGLSCSSTGVFRYRFSREFPTTASATWGVSLQQAYSRAIWPCSWNNIPSQAYLYSIALLKTRNKSLNSK